MELGGKNGASILTFKISTCRVFIKEILKMSHPIR
jgi:hypothetical protein